MKLWNSLVKSIKKKKDKVSKLTGHSTSLSWASWSSKNIIILPLRSLTLNLHYILMIFV